MKLSTTDITALKTILDVCELVNIDAIVIADGKVSGINTNNTCLILSDKNLPELETDVKLGLTRLKMLKSRLALFGSDVSIDIDVNAKNEATMLNIKGSNASVQYRATSPAKIKYPKNVDDAPIRSVAIGKEQALMLLNAGKAMGAENVAFLFKKKNEVVVEFTDNNQEVFSTSLTNPYEEISSDASSSSSYLPLDTFTPLLKTALNETSSDVNITFCDASALITVSGHEVRMFSQTSA